MKHNINISKLIQSLKNMHNEVSVQTLKQRVFKAGKHFLSWKEAEEESTYTFFVQPKGASTNITEETGIPR